MFIAALRGKTVNSRKPFSSTTAARGQNGFENGTNSLLSGHTHQTLAIYITFYVFFFLSFHKTPNGYMPVATICTPYTPYIYYYYSLVQQRTRIVKSSFTASWPASTIIMSVFYVHKTK